jgi:hypothetical protein
MQIAAIVCAEEDGRSNDSLSLNLLKNRSHNPNANNTTS